MIQPCRIFRIHVQDDFPLKAFRKQVSRLSAWLGKIKAARFCLFFFHAMKIRAVLGLLLTLSLISCSYYFGNPDIGLPFGPKDYGLMVAQPYPQEVLLAKKRLQNFLQRGKLRNQKTLQQTAFVAIEASQLSAGEIFAILRLLGTGQIRANTFYSTDPYNRAAVPVKFLLIFDWRSQRLAAPDGILVIDTPNRGTIGQFGGFRSVYGGTGWW